MTKTTHTHDDIDVPTIRRAWNQATSASPEEWSTRNRARGQCAITACAVQDCLGGKLIRTVVTTPDGFAESHYANLLDHDVILDLTDSQFPEGAEFGPWEERTREYVLGFEETRRRYDILCRRINEVRTVDMMTNA